MARKVNASNDNPNKFIDVDEQESIITPESAVSLEGAQGTPIAQVDNPIFSSLPDEETVKVSDVKKLFAEFMKEKNEQDSSISLIKKKKVEKHLKTVYRFNSKWVVDFVNRNTDQYQKQEVYAFNKFNPSTKRDEWHLELKYDDGSTEEVSGYTYLRYRVPVLCVIEKREKIDVSYQNGTTERKVVVNDGFKKIGTGDEVALEVEMFKEMFHMGMPDGQTLIIPDYALA